jgi:serine/threonine protein kinase
VSQSIVQPLRRWDPERIGPFAIIGKLGAGAMGQVFLARSPAGRLVAVKTIRIELAEEPGFRARFAREVAAASRVSGVFTAAVIEADADADRPWVATAYVPAPTLRTLVRACGPLPVPAVRWLAAGCAEALQSIHGAGLLHRDVKPSNVLMAPDGPRVIDFGVARAAERVQLTTTRGAAGTPAYMAPEQARDATQASPASDIFSLGATLVFAATGHPPYRGETVMDILVRLATEPPDLTGMPDELAGLVTSCLERVPRDRPTDAAILEALGQFALLPADAGHSYLPDSAMELIGEYQRGPRLPAGGGAAANGAADEDEDDGAIGSATNDSGAPARSVPSAAGDVTSGSHTALPGFETPAALHAGHEPPPRHARQRERSRPGARRPLPGMRPLAWAGAAAAAVALVGAGTGLGIALRWPAGPASGTGQGQQGAQLGCTSPVASSTPQLCVSQTYGDSYTVFVIHGSGFTPFAQVTVQIPGVGTSPDHPVADRLGTFNYAIGQDRRFLADPIPPGNYSVVVTAAGRRPVSASFLVSPPPPPGPQPTGPPPTGAPPLGPPPGGVPPPGQG